MKIIFMGTPDFSVPALEALAQGGHQILAAVTQPDRQKGRGKAVLMTPVKERAIALSIPVYQPEKVREPSFVELLKGMRPDVIVVVAFGQILPKAVLDIPQLGCVNIHASLLPKYRGAAPIQWSIIDGESQTGITTMMMDTGLDTGDMLEQCVVPIAPKETGGSLHDKLSRAGGELILSTLEQLEHGTAVRTPQPKEGSSYARMLDKALGEIDWAMDGASIERLVRGLNPWPSAYTWWNGKMIKIWDADVVKESDGKMAEPGRIVHVDHASILVQTGRGLLAVQSLQLEGKKRMDAGAFLRGYEMKDGMFLGKM